MCISELPCTISVQGYTFTGGDIDQTGFIEANGDRTFSWTGDNSPENALAASVFDAECEVTIFTALIECLRNPS